MWLGLMLMWFGDLGLMCGTEHRFVERDTRESPNLQVLKIISQYEEG